MKTLLAALIIAALALQPRRASADPEPQVAPVVGCAIVVIGVGATIVWGLWKICDRVFPKAPTNPPPPPPPGTNGPTNKVTSTVSSSLIDDVSTVFHLAVESCTNLAAPVWIREARITGTMNGGQVVFVTEAAGQVATSAANIGTMTYHGETYWAITNDIHALVDGLPPRKEKFWRLVACE